VEEIKPEEIEDPTIRKLALGETQKELK